MEPSPLLSYAGLLRSLPDVSVPNPRQPVLVSLSEHMGAPPGLSVNADALLDWAGKQQRLSPSTLWRLRDTFRAWDVQRPTRHQVASFLETLANLLRT